MKDAPLVIYVASDINIFYCLTLANIFRLQAWNLVVKMIRSWMREN